MVAARQSCPLCGEPLEGRSIRAIELGAVGMPADTVALWRSLRANGLWQQRIGDVIEACATISTSGPLAVLLDGRLGVEG
ncbi:MAG: hypothetical protein IAG13_00230 [Deltaproteobacteria bacterium]|nr:hypothetical protein [Nannocystaceae bacterium]